MSVSKCSRSSFRTLGLNFIQLSILSWFGELLTLWVKFLGLVGLKMNPSNSLRMRDLIFDLLFLALWLAELSDLTLLQTVPEVVAWTASEIFSWHYWPYWFIYRSTKHTESNGWCVNQRTLLANKVYIFYLFFFYSILLFIFAGSMHS